MRKHQNILIMILTRKTECVKLLNYHSYSTQQLFSYHLTYKMTKDTRTPLCSCPSDNSLRWEKLNLIFTLLSVLSLFIWSYSKTSKEKKKKKRKEKCSSKQNLVPSHCQENWSTLDHHSFIYALASH